MVLIKKAFLAAVIHEDMFDFEINEELVDFNEVEVELIIKGDKV